MGNNDIVPLSNMIMKKYKRIVATKQKPIFTHVQILHLMIPQNLNNLKQPYFIDVDLSLYITCLYIYTITEP